MAFVQLLQTLLRDKNMRPRVVPIIPDEARTFGMEGMFRPLGIYSIVGQKYKPEDADQLAFYKEDIKGQILEEGITEAGAMSSWIAAATSYANHGVVAAAVLHLLFDVRLPARRRPVLGRRRHARARLPARRHRRPHHAQRRRPAAPGRPQPRVQRARCRTAASYDPAFAYELAVIIQHGMKQMYVEHQDVYYYLSVYNENYAHPADAARASRAASCAACTCCAPRKSRGKLHVQLLGSGTILREVIAAAELLQEEWGVTSDVWSVPSFTELARDGEEAERWNLLHPQEKPRKSYVQECLERHDRARRSPAPTGSAPTPSRSGPYRADAVPRARHRRLRPLATTARRCATSSRSTGAGSWCARSKALAEQKLVPAERVSQAIKIYGIKPERPPPWTV